MEKNTMGIEKITVDGEDHEIDVKPITLITTGPHMPNIEYPDRLEISDRDTLYHIERVNVLHESFWVLWEYVHQKAKQRLPCGADSVEIRKLGTGHKHLAGMLDLLLKMQDQGVPIVLKHPESHLHPSLQMAMTDALILLMKRGEELSK